MSILDTYLTFVGLAHVLGTLIKELLDDIMLEQELELVYMDLCDIQIDSCCLVHWSFFLVPLLCRAIIKIVLLVIRSFEIHLLLRMLFFFLFFNFNNQVVVNSLLENHLVFLYMPNSKLGHVTHVISYDFTVIVIVVVGWLVLGRLFRNAIDVVQQYTSLQLMYEFARLCNIHGRFVQLLLITPIKVAQWAVTKRLDQAFMRHCPYMDSLWRRAEKNFLSFLIENDFFILLWHVFNFFLGNSITNFFMSFFSALDHLSSLPFGNFD